VPLGKETPEEEWKVNVRMNYATQVFSSTTTNNENITINVVSAENQILDDSAMDQTEFGHFVRAQKNKDVPKILSFLEPLSEERLPKDTENELTHFTDWLERPHTLGQLALFELTSFLQTGSF
jgi:hypothetical protein